MPWNIEEIIEKKKQVNILKKQYPYLSMSEIARKTGVSRTTVSNWLTIKLCVRHKNEMSLKMVLGLKRKQKIIITDPEYCCFCKEENIK